MIRAEVIGDPIAHSKSPAIHNFWLDCLGIEGSYERALVPPSRLASYLRERAQDPRWAGCNVTSPHKRSVIPLLDDRGPVGAVNCIVPRSGGLFGLNTDVDGIAEALAGTDLSRCVLIGAGGAAEAALACLADADMIVRITRQNIANVERLEGATLVINATPLGMAHAAPMPDALLDRLPAGAVAFDMVYEPLDTPFLQAARARGLRAIDGHVMLVGQARRSFLHFFGAEPPRDRDAELREILSA